MPAAKVCREVRGPRISRWGDFQTRKVDLAVGKEAATKGMEQGHAYEDQDGTRHETYYRRSPDKSADAKGMIPVMRPYGGPGTVQVEESYEPAEAYTDD